jgi:hypothetical protein
MVWFLMRALQTALGENAELTRANAELKASAHLLADLYEQSIERAKNAEADLKGLRGSPARPATLGSVIRRRQHC